MPQEPWPFGKQRPEEDGERRLALLLGALADEKKRFPKRSRRHGPSRPQFSLRGQERGLGSVLTFAG